MGVKSKKGGRFAVTLNVKTFFSVKCLLSRKDKYKSNHATLQSYCINFYSKFTE